MLKKELKEIEKRLGKLDKKLKKDASFPEHVDRNIKRGTKEVIKLLDDVIEKNILSYKKKFPKKKNG